MEDVLEVYARAYHPRRPVVCMDETHKQLIGEVREPLPVEPGQPERVEHEYVRNGVAQIFLEVEPLTGRSHVEAGERRTRQDWARWIEGMLERRYPEAERVVLVMDNLNTHGIESLYATYEHPTCLAAAFQAWPRCNARSRLGSAIGINGKPRSTGNSRRRMHSPTGGTTRNPLHAEARELAQHCGNRTRGGQEEPVSTLCGQCLDRRIPSLAQMQREIEAWVGESMSSAVP